MFEPPINDATTIAGNSRPAQGNKIVRVAHVKHVVGKARAGGKCKTFLKKVIIWLVWLVAILALAVVGVIGGFLWRDGAAWEAEMTQETERTKSEWEERERNGADAADNGHTKVQLWKGGPYWADTNIGAEKPWEPGYYFWWGDTVGYKRQGGVWMGSWVASDGSNSDFSFEEEKNTPTCMMSIDKLLSEGWITSDDILMREHDAAYIHWGGGWRMPTEQELDDLMSECNWTRATMNGVNGYVVRGRGAYADASIFLPCTGYGGPWLYHPASEGRYWSSVPSLDSYCRSWCLSFNSSNYGTRSSVPRNGFPVRPVQGFTKKRTK